MNSFTINIDGREFPVTVNTTRAGEARAWVCWDEGAAGPFVLDDAGRWAHNYHTHCATLDRIHGISPAGTPTGETLSVLLRALNEARLDALCQTCDMTGGYCGHCSGAHWSL